MIPAHSASTSVPESAQVLGLGRGVPATLRELGIDPGFTAATATADTLVSREPASLPDSRAPLLAVSRAAEQTGCSHLGLLIAERMDVIAHLGVLGKIIESSATVGQALKEICDYSPLKRLGSIWELTATGDVACLRYDPRYLSADTSMSCAAVITLVMGIQARVIRHISQNRCHPAAIYFGVRRPREASYFQRFFRSPVVFDADFNGFVFRTEDFDIAVPSGDRDLRQILQHYVNLTSSGESATLVSRTRRVIEGNLNAGVCSIDAVSRHLAFSRTTLQRKLRQEGSSYRALLDDIRFEKAAFLLHSTDISLSRISALLCYENLSAFTRAFKRRTGQSPSAWRRRGGHPRHA